MWTRGAQQSQSALHLLNDQTNSETTTMNIRHIKPLVFILAGLIGMASYEISLRFFHSAFLGGDFIHGAWLGLSIGLEIIGLILLVKSKAGFMR